MRYGNVIFDGKRSSSVNIGDDLQLLAVEHLYMKMGIEGGQIVRIPFSQLSTYVGEYVILPISFPLYGYRDGLFITNFSPYIIPVFLGLSMMSDNILPAEVDYFKRFEPILCRDFHTVQLLRKNQIEAYMGGCLTLTLTTDLFRTKVERKPSNVYLVDISEKYKEWIPDSFTENAIECSQILDSCENPEEEMRKRLMLYYVDAALVITTRLHCAMPCVALGIPVVILKDKYSFRFPTLSKFVPIYTEETKDCIDWSGKINDDYRLTMKKYVLENAIDLVKTRYQKYERICKISEEYEAQDRLNGYIEHYDNVIEYIKHRWGDNAEQDIHYAIWGITQKADLICAYMENNYPNSKLLAVYDRTKKVMFHGVHSTDDIEMLLDEDTFVFVTAATANIIAKKKFTEINKGNYHISSDGIEIHNNVL